MDEVFLAKEIFDLFFHPSCILLLKKTLSVGKDKPITRWAHNFGFEKHYNSINTNRIATHIS